MATTPAQLENRVLVIEDDADLQQSIRAVLEEEGHRVQTAANGEEALSVLEREGRPCLILLDLMMPVMDGWQFLEKKNRDQRLGNCPVIVVSECLERPKPGSPAFAAPHLKVDGVIRKPLDLRELVEAVAARCR